MTDNPLQKALDNFHQHPSSEWLLEELWKPNSPTRQLLMCHRDSLFLSIGELAQGEIAGLSDIRFPFFIVVGNPTIEVTSDFPFSKSSEGDEDAEEDEEDQFNFLNDEIAFLFVHGFIMVIRDNPSLMKLISAPDYDYEMLLRETKGMKEISTDIISKELAPLGQDSE
jgi:hypothetical protein